MRMTADKKEILTYFEPESLEWMTCEIGLSTTFGRIRSYLFAVWHEVIQETAPARIYPANVGSNGEGWVVRKVSRPRTTAGHYTVR
jgi:hypothetical protein